MKNNIKYQELKEMILKTLKERLKKAKLSTESAEPAPAPVKTPPKTAPTKKPNPLKIPQISPGTKPAPKASLKENTIKNKDIQKESFKNYLKEVDEKSRFRRNLNESPPMDFDNPNPRYRPDPNFQSGIEGRGPSPFANIEFLQKKTLDKSTLEKLGSEEFNAVVNTLIAAGPLNVQGIMNTLNSIEIIERGHRKALENLAIETVAKNFGLSDEIKERITATITPAPSMDDEDSSDDESEPIEILQRNLTPDEKRLAKKYIDRRVVQNALMMGSGYRAHKLFDGVKGSLDAINPQIYPLYEKLMPNVEFYLWTMVMPVESRQNWGVSKVTNSGGGEAQGKMFLILLHETAKVAVELLFLQSLDDIKQEHGEEISAYVIKQSDKYEEEQWMKLIGPRLWKYFHDAIDFIVKEKGGDYTIVSYLLNRVGSLPPEEFLALMDNVVNDGPAAIHTLEAITAQLEKEIEEYQNQNNETPDADDITPEPDMDKIGGLVNSALDDIFGEKTDSGVPKKLEDKEISEMTKEELNIYLTWAIENEEYMKAAQTRDELSRR